MQIKYLIAFVLWFGFVSVVYNQIPAEILSGASTDYDFVDDVNISGFDEDEIDSGGFFSGIIGVTSSIFRFFGFLFFGIGCCGTGTPSFVSVFFIFWNTVITLLFIAFIINSFWNP